jgi:hypothetical protein
MGQFEEPLGRLVMNFGAIEDLLGLGISVLISKDHRVGATVARPLSFDSRLRVYDALVRLRINDPKTLVDHEALMKDLQSLQQRRNNLIHGAWFDLENTNIDEVKGKLKQPRLALNKGFKPGEMEYVTPAQVAVESQFSQALFEQLRRAIESYMPSGEKG